ncbi:hypothetical protein BLIC30S_04587 [Bacillus licheniformis]
MSTLTMKELVSELLELFKEKVYDSHCMAKSKGDKRPCLKN